VTREAAVPCAPTSGANSHGELNALPGISIPEDAIDRFPSTPLIVLRDPRVREDFLQVLDGEWG